LSLSEGLDALEVWRVLRGEVPLFSLVDPHNRVLYCLEKDDQVHGRQQGVRIEHEGGISPQETGAPSLGDRGLDPS
jgi:hypothetical protein